MQNVTVRVEGSTLHIAIDTSKDLGVSSTGKTNRVASTEGNQKIAIGGREIYLGVNAYTKRA